MQVVSLQRQRCHMQAASVKSAVVHEAVDRSTGGTRASPRAIAQGHRPRPRSVAPLKPFAPAAERIEGTCSRLLRRGHPTWPSDMDKTGLGSFAAKAGARAEALLFAAAASAQACFAAQIPHHDHLQPPHPPPTTHNAVASLPKNRAGESHPTHSQLGPQTRQHLS
jgi:hypothetical protein